MEMWINWNYLSVDICRIDKQFKPKMEKIKQNKK